MENASRALVMAAELLIAVIILATLLYAASYWGIIPSAKDNADEARQAAEFNQQFESYNRQAIYGADLVSVLNKAINNNYMYSANNGDGVYVDIKFHILTDVDTKIIKYKRTYNRDGTYIDESTKESNDTELEADSYSLSTDLNKINNFLKLIQNSSYIEEKSQKLDNNNKIQQYTKHILSSTDFKVRGFKCEEVSYNSDGKINYMYFIEIPQEVLDGE